MTFIDFDNPANFSNKILTEKKTRMRILQHARIVGCEREMLLLFNRVDAQLRNCRNASERKDIGKLGAVEMFNLLGNYGKLYVDNELVINKE